MEIGNKVRYFDTTTGWEIVTLLELPKNAFDYTAKIKRGDGKEGYVSMNRIEELK